MLRQAELAAERAHLVLEQFAQGLDQLHLHALGQTADIVMRLDGGRGPAQRRDAFDHVGIERALGQEFGAADLLGFGVEDVDEAGADDLALLFGVADAFEPRKEQFLGFGMDQRDVVVAPEQRDDLLRLARAHQPGVDEDAGELVADRFMDQDRGHGRIDAARKPADHARRAHLGADLGDLLLAEGLHAPVGRDAGHVLHEVRKQRRRRAGCARPRDGTAAP